MPNALPPAHDLPSAHEVILCRGTHRERGLAQGEAGRVAIERVLGAFFGGPEFALTAPRFIPKALHRRLARWKARRSLEPSLRREVPEQVERMEAIAAGSGFPLDVLYLAVGAELLLNEVYWLPGACSALGVRGSRSADGAARIAKTFDYPPAYTVGFCVRRNEPAEGFASLDVTVAALAGCHSGVNEAGLALTYNYGYGQDSGASRTAISLLVQRLLERCATVDEAVALTEATPRAGGAILSLADAGGALAALELSPGRTARREPVDDLLLSTNHYLDPHLAEVDVPRDAVHCAPSLPELVGVPVHESSLARLAGLEAYAERTGSFDEAALVGLLSDHGVDAQGAPLPGAEGSVCRHGDYYQTTCGVVLDPRARSLGVVFGRPCEQTLVTHVLECEAQVGS